MRLFQSILMLFIFPLAIFGQINWIIDKETGCKIQNPYPKKYESVKWSGDCVDSIACGYGTLIWKRYGKDTNCKYVGTMVNGLPNGIGDYFVYHNLKYSGEFKNGKLNGRGIKVTGEYKYDGEFIDDELNGFGKLYKNGILMYEGEFVNSIENGQGKMYESNGSIFEGAIENGYYKTGRLISLSGYEAEGTWQNYQLISGTIKFLDGRIYIGEVKDWKPNGLGEMVFPDGTSKKGIWKKGNYMN